MEDEHQHQKPCLLPYNFPFCLVHSHNLSGGPLICRSYTISSRTKPWTPSISLLTIRSWASLLGTISQMTALVCKLGSHSYFTRLTFGTLGVIQLDPYLSPFKDALKSRYNKAQSWIKTINETEGGLEKFSRVRSPLIQGETVALTHCLQSGL